MLPECLLQPNCGCHATVPPTEEQIRRHEAEHCRRLNWCINNKLCPAFDHIHKAPGDDKEFVYGVPPWNKDGSVNPCGVYAQPETESDKILLSYCKESSDSKWNCQKCGKEVPRKPSIWKGKKGDEPWNWWFCFDCKNKYSKPPLKKIKEQKVAKTCHNIEQFFTKKN